MSYNNFLQGHKKRLLVTKQGLDKLRQKLDTIMTKRLDAIKKLRTIDKRDADGLYLSTHLQDLEHTEIEAAKLCALLQHVDTVIKRVAPTEVTVGCEVNLLHAGKMVLYTIVCPLELDIEHNRISEESILGKAVLGKKIGDSFSIVTPKGTLTTYKVVSIN